MNKYAGLYKGIVEDNEDPKKQGRLKIRVPSVHGNNKEVPWAVSGTPFGIYPPYPKGTIVWVMFQGGDPHYPVFTGYSLKKNGGCCGQ